MPWPCVLQKATSPRACRFAPRCVLAHYCCVSPKDLCPQDGVSPQCCPPVSLLRGRHVPSRLSQPHPNQHISNHLSSPQQTLLRDRLSSYFNLRCLSKSGNLDPWQPGPQGVSFLPCCSLIISLYKAPPAAGGLGFRTVVFLTTTQLREISSPWFCRADMSNREQNNNVMILLITPKVVLDTMSITPGQIYPPGLRQWHQKGFCEAEGGWITMPGYCPAEEMGHFPENFQPSRVSDAVVGQGAGVPVP